MENTRSIIDKIGRKRFLLRSGLSKQALIRPLAENQFPANWFWILDEMCSEVGILCPKELFAFRRPEDMAPDDFLPVQKAYQGSKKKSNKIAA